jgi:hypothetical protein
LGPDLLLHLGRADPTTASRTGHIRCFCGRYYRAPLNALDTGVRGGPEPTDITLESFGMIIPEA